METWKLDRMCTWLMSGIGINTDNHLLYLVDRKEKILFNLTKDKNDIGFRRYQFKLSNEEMDLLTKLKSRFQNADSDILVINKNGKYSDLLPIDKFVDYKIRESKWNSLGKEMRDFLEENELNLEEYKLIE